MINAIAAFFTHIPESIGLLAAGIAMAATAAGLRNLIQAGSSPKVKNRATMPAKRSRQKASYE
ncbi:MAG: hypothetical protein UZ17_ACD001000931 [Acidobacteria bacterium OLB17]|nr:MAG: hypothetical protein UZ17_ACD001000931 [Acidobacteria bacterium OLB17]